MKECPGNCKSALDVLRGMRGIPPAVHAAGGWWRHDDVVDMVGGRSSTRKRLNDLVKLGLVERRKMTSATCSHYALFRAKPQNTGLLFDLPPADRTIVNPKGPAVRSPRPGDQP